MHTLVRPRCPSGVDPAHVLVCNRSSSQNYRGPFSGWTSGIGDAQNGMVPILIIVGRFGPNLVDSLSEGSLAEVI